MQRHTRSWLSMALMLILSMLAQPTRSEVIREIDLTKESADLLIFGASAGDAMQSVATGDFNGDGFLDILFGAPGRDTDAGFNVGIVLVVFGPLQAGVRDLREFPPGFSMSGDGGCCPIGIDVTAGDLNGDGIDDMIVNTLHRIHIVFGSPELTGHLDLAERQADLTIRGLLIRDLGVGDYNGDGIQDLAVGTRSVSGQFGDSVIVLFGSSGLVGTIDFALQSPDVVIRGFDRRGIGRSMASGDINGDGIDDLILGMDATPSLAVVEVIFGSPDLSGTVDLRTQNPDLRIVGDFYSFGVGLAVDDFDGDGVKDIAIGTPYAFFAGRRYAGKVEIILGKPDLAGVRNLVEQPAELTIVGAKEDHVLGAHPGALKNGLSTGDVNGDGIGDLLVSAVVAPSADGRLYLSGEAYAIFGGAARPCFRDLAIEPAEIIVHGGGHRDYLGERTAAGDVNGDGIDDMIFMADGGDGFNNTRGWAGDAYILFGRHGTAERRTLLELIQAMPEDAFVSQGHRRSMLSQAKSIEDMLNAGHTAGAARLLDQMERRLSPCYGEIGRDDWLESCTARTHFRCIVEQMKNALPSLPD